MAKDTNAEVKAKDNAKVKIKLFKDNYKYKDDVFVGVCGKTFQIKRGEEVEVPVAVAAILEQSLKQDNETAALIARETSRAAKADALL